jgi:hypothetical protein
MKGWVIWSIISRGRMPMRSWRPSAVDDHRCGGEYPLGRDRMKTYIFQVKLAQQEDGRWSS